MSDLKSDHSQRSVTIDEMTAQVLRRHRKIQAEEQIAWGPLYENGNLVFCRENGSPIDPSWLSKRFASLVEQTQLPRLSLHGLRHTHATLALEAGVHPKIVSERLGHSKVAFTLDRYTHKVKGLEENAAQRIAGLLFGNRS